MFEKFKASILFNILLKRPDINKAYAMVPPTDSWYDTITTVHNSLAEIQQLPHRMLEITSHDGYTLKAVYYPAEKPCNRTAIWVHGYTSHAERESAFPALFYHSIGYNVLIPYLRAHGPSEGKYISLGALEHQDMLKWVELINELNPDDQIIIHGLSMGGGIVLDLASKDMKNVLCLISDAPSVTIEDLFRNVAKSVFKKDGEKVAEHTISRFQKEFHATVSDFDRVKIIRGGKYPLLLSAGSNEQMDETLTRIAQNNPMKTTIVILHGCNHGNGMYKQTEMYQSAIREFIDSTAATKL